MRRAYKLLFRVRLLHGYYTNGISHDFSVVPTPETARWLKDNYMLFRIDDTGFRIFYTADTKNTPDAPFIPFDAIRLRFMLLLENPGKFFNITDLTIDGKVCKSGNIVEFVNNGTVSGDLNQHLIQKAEPGIFTYEFPQVVSPASASIGKLEVFDEQNEQISISDPDTHFPDPDEIHHTPDGRFFYPLDLTSYPVGVYKFKSYVDDANEAEERIYLDGQLKKMSVFGMVHIDLPASSLLFDPGEEPAWTYTAPDYNARFSAKTPYWRYLMIMKNEPVGTLPYAVIDEKNEYTFTQRADTEINGIQTLVYDSDTAIALSEKPINSFQFIKNPGEEEKELIAALSNPSLNNVTDLSPEQPDITQVYVYV